MEMQAVLDLLHGGTKPLKYDDDPICAVYFLMDRGVVVYVGESLDVHQRVRGHWKHRFIVREQSERHPRLRSSKIKQFDSARYLECKPDERHALELRFIAFFQPKYNGSNLKKFAMRKSQGLLPCTIGGAMR